MSKNDENNSHLFIKNNSTQNLYLPSHQKNKSSNFLSDSPSTLITVQIQSLNGDQNSKSKDKTNPDNKSTSNIYSPKNIRSKSNLNEITSKKEEDKEKFEQTPSSNQIIINNNINDSNSYLIKDINLSYSSSKPDMDSKSLKEINNFKMKYSKLYGQYSANTPKQISSVYNGIKAGPGADQGNILVKKNLRLGIQRTKNSPDIIERKKENENKIRYMRNDNYHNKNDYVKYVNNDKYNFNGNLLNMTQNNNPAKYVLSQSKSFTKIEKKNSAIGANALNNNSNNNGNNNNGITKKSHNFNYINYNNYKNNSNIKKKELTVLTKNNNTHRTNNKNDSNNHNNINSFAFQNLSTSPNANNHVQSYFNNIAKNNYIKKNAMSNKTSNNENNRSKNKSSGGNKSNNTSSNNISNNPSGKNIYFMKPTQQRKKSSYGKNHEISTNNKDTNQSSLRSKNKKDNGYKNTLDSTFLNDIFNKNIENPEELHFFYIKILQNGNEISKKFEIDSI